MTASPRHRFDLPTIGAGLVVSDSAEQIRQAAAAGAFVITAPPGTGKTTVVPPLMSDLLAAQTPDGEPVPVTLVTQPRRIAVRAAARRIAQLDGSAVGGPVGFTVRGERTVSDQTQLEFLTPGVLLRRLLTDPALEGVGAVVIDEVHERSVDSDLLLGMLAEVRELREDLLVVAMSATLDADAIAALLASAAAPAPIVDIPSVLHPLTVEYAPPPQGRWDRSGMHREVPQHVAACAVSAQARTGSDVLVFMPGVREVDSTARHIRDRVGADVEVMTLHGQLPPHAQDKVTAGRRQGERPRIVVSTALAESSLTVPGVHVVVDGGFSREVRRDRGRDMSGLVTVSCSQASALQRAGRAARLGPGLVVRAYSENDFARMPAEAAPDITTTDLLDTALLLAAWGTPRAEGLRLLTPPPPREISQAVDSLRALNLMGDDGRATPLGNHVARLPVGVREARALLVGASEVGSRAAAEVVAALSSDLRADGADLPGLLRNIRDQRWQREARRLESLVRRESGSRDRAAESGTRASAAESGSRVGAANTAKAATGADAAGHVIALGRPEWIARRTAGHSRSYLCASGTRASLPEGSRLLGNEWLAIWDIHRSQARAADGTGAVIRLAAPLTPDQACDLAGDLFGERRTARIESGTVKVRNERHLGAIVLASTPVAATPEDTAPAVEAHLREHGLSTLTWDDAALALRRRLSLLHHEYGEPWPAMDDASLCERLDEWLTPDLATVRGGSLSSLNLSAALRRLLPWPEASRMEELAPERLPVPSGSTVALDYPALWHQDASLTPSPPPSAQSPQDSTASPQGSAQVPQPSASVKLQEVFGLAETPRLCPGGVSGGVPVVFHLLSPARRPLAVTADLSSFWNGPYAQVRKEMRGRYPKHPWPEDPWTAPATARTTKRM